MRTGRSDVLKQASSKQYVFSFSLEISGIKISRLQEHSGNFSSNAHSVARSGILDRVVSCNVAALTFLCFVMLPPSIFKIYWRGGGTLKSSHSS